MKKYPKAQEEARSLTSQKKGLLIETVTPETGAPLEQVALPEVDLSRGWNDERFAQISGEYALVHGEHSNTVIYRLDTGGKVGEFFGTPVATDSATGLIAAVNREDEIDSGRGAYRQGDRAFYAGLTGQAGANRDRQETPGADGRPGSASVAASGVAERNALGDFHFNLLL